MMKDMLIARFCLATVVAAGLAAALGGCATGVASMAGSVAASKPMTAGPLEISVDRLDLGTVKAEAGALIQFSVTNKGKIDVRLSNCTTSCACQVYQIPEVVPAGGTVKAEFILIPPPDWSGPKDDELTVQTNLANVKQFAIKLHANVQWVANVKQGSAISYDFKPGEKARMPITISPREDAKLGKVTVQPAWLKASLEKKADGSLDGFVVSDNPIPAGDFTAQITVDCPNLQRSRTITIAGQATKGPVASPSTLELPYLSSNKPGLLGNVSIWTRSGRVQIKSVESADKHLEFVKGVSPKGMSQFVVWYRGGWQPGRDRQVMVHVKTDDLRYPILDVPILVRTVL
jgi:hypothetical protein